MFHPLTRDPTALPGIEADTIYRLVLPAGTARVVTASAAPTDRRDAFPMVAGGVLAALLVRASEGESVFAWSTDSISPLVYFPAIIVADGEAG